MRFLIIVFAVLAINLTHTCWAGGHSFETFMKSREVLATLRFQANSDSLTAAVYELVYALLPDIENQQKAGKLIRVEGFASPEGDRADNLRLSLHRARNVADIMVHKGLPAEVMLTGYGDFLSGTDDPAKERRVEIVAYDKPQNLRKMQIVELIEKQKNTIIKSAVSVSAIEAPKEPIIDAWAIEQAIMEKIGAEPVQLAATVSRVD